jgi:futalosine hydrolase
MPTLLVSATEFEISATAQWLNSTYRDNNVEKPELLISGIGQLQTAYALQKKLGTHRPGLIIQAGIGGTISPENLGKSFVIISEEIADLGAQEKEGFMNIFEMGLAGSDDFPFRHGKLPNPYRTLLGWTELPQADGVTVNEIKPEKIYAMQRNRSTVVESMEGAALHYVCLMEKIPFLQIRGISNIVGERNKAQWKLKEAINDLNKSLISLIQKLEQADETLFRI